MLKCWLIHVVFDRGRNTSLSPMNQYWKRALVRFLVAFLSTETLHFPSLYSLTVSKLTQIRGLASSMAQIALIAPPTFIAITTGMYHSPCYQIHHPTSYLFFFFSFSWFVLCSTKWNDHLIWTGRGKHELSYARKKVNLASVVPSRKMEKASLFVSSNSGGERSRSVAVKVSEGGAISLPQPWPPQKVSIIKETFLIIILQQINY